MPLKVAARGAFSVLAESPFASDGQKNSKRPQEIFLAHRESTGATREKVSIAQVPPVGVTVVMRKKFSQGFQLEWNYTWFKDEDDDSNERHPFADLKRDLTSKLCPRPRMASPSIAFFDFRVLLR